MTVTATPLESRDPRRSPVEIVERKGLGHPDPDTLWEINYLLAKLTVGEVMSRNVIAIESDREPREAAQLMLDHGIGALPVVDGGLLVGIITETDLLRAFVHTV